MRVLLVHGLGRTPASLFLLAQTLRRAGHVPSNFSYFAFAESYEHIRGRLVQRLQALASESNEPVALIGHSLGGLLLRHALSDVPSLPVHRLVMLGTPNRAPRRARRVEGWLPFRVFARSSGALLASAQRLADIPGPAVPYTIVAGTGGYRWLSKPFGTEPHDGVVAVSETRINDADEPVLLDVSHTFMMNDRRLQRFVLALLAGAPDSS
jgi:pimeloyl-ACP methyl ester carboxylesterase